MPDFAMCIETGCPKSKQCKRHSDSGTKPGVYQSYAGFDYANGCEEFWPAWEGVKRCSE